MTDVFDRAQAADAFRRDLAIRAFRAGAEEFAKPSAFLLCDDCTGPIPAERRKAVPSATRCVDCQVAHERRLRTVR